VHDLPMPGLLQVNLNAAWDFSRGGAENTVHSR
jgi:hypothetical protein